jgi:sec-independent protein translocase protein TatA
VEIVLILLVALLVFGRRLPEVARSLGQGMTEFRKGLRDEPADTGPQPLPEVEDPVATTCEDGGEETRVGDGDGDDEDPERPPREEPSPAG